MAIYKIFPEKDTFISSYRSTQNFGRDEILEIFRYAYDSSTSLDTTRALIQFPNTSFQDVITNTISGSAYSASLKLYLANALLPADYTLFGHRLTTTWNMGLGRSADSPITTAGCTWISPWTTPGGDYNATAYSQSFLYTDNKDLDMDITTLVNYWYSNPSLNYGILLKQSSSVESNTTSSLGTKFFSMDTHTIYPPQIELKWNDSLYSTTLTQLTSSNFIPVISNNKAEFEENTIYTFRIKCRDTFPARSFSTSSVYLNPKALPSTTYWALKDAKTEEIIIDFDTTFTKVSCDNTSNYFKLYMNGLEPERYYQILIKTVLSNGETLIIDDKSNYFKIVR
jgi:hypothetical protein